MSCSMTAVAAEHMLHVYTVNHQSRQETMQMVAVNMHVHALASQRHRLHCARRTAPLYRKASWLRRVDTPLARQANTFSDNNSTPRILPSSIHNISTHKHQPAKTTSSCEQPPLSQQPQHHLHSHLHLDGLVRLVVKQREVLCSEVVDVLLVRVDQQPREVARRVLQLLL